MNKIHIISRNSLVGILAYHKIWLESEKKRGTRAEFNKLDFYISSYHPHSRTSQGQKFFSQSDKKLLENTNFDVTKTLMQGVLLEEAIIIECSFDGVLFQGANLKEAEIKNTRLSRTRLKGGHLNNCKIDNSKFHTSYLRSAVFDEAKIYLTSFIGSYCDKASFIKAIIENSDFSRTYLVKANFNQSKIRNTIFNGVKLRKSIFDESNITNSDFKNVYFNNSSFIKAKVLYTNFENSDCSHTDFSSTVFNNVNLINVNFNNCNLTNVILKKTNLTGSSFENITIDEDTRDILPLWVIEKYGNTFKIEKIEKNLNSIKKSIHFEPEHRQAGIGILSYFSKILDELYPNRDIRFRIEQDNNIISLVIETPEGNLIERIEKTLIQYGEIIAGLIPVSSITDNALLILDLKTELRIAKLRIDSQSDLLAYKDGEISRLFDTITRSLGNSNVKLFVSQNLNNEDANINMGDTYKAGQVGAQGSNAQAHNTKFNQIWQENQSEFDFEVLSKELTMLIDYLKKDAHSSEHFAEITSIADAKQEANNKNGSKMLDKLSNVGKWALDAATKIGVSVATEAIKNSANI